MPSPNQNLIPTLHQHFLPAKSISGTIRLLLWPRQVSCWAAHCCAIFLCCIDLAGQLYTCCLSKSTQNPDHHLSVIGTNARCSFTPLGEIFNAIWVLCVLFNFHISDALLKILPELEYLWPSSECTIGRSDCCEIFSHRNLLESEVP